MVESAETVFQQHDTFWQLIERTRDASNGDSDKQAELIIAELVQYPAEAIIEFDWIIRQYMAQAYRQDLWDAAYIINCGCGDGGFKDFRAWLIAQGKAIYEAALEDAETLVNIVEADRETFAFEILVVASDAYERKMTEEMPRYLFHKEVLLGEVDYDKNLSEADWEEQLAQSYPKLHAKFGDCVGHI
jgi:hypothetical protein